MCILEVIAKHTNEYMELEKTVSETENAKAKVYYFVNSLMNL